MIVACSTQALDVCTAAAASSRSAQSADQKLDDNKLNSFHHVATAKLECDEGHHGCSDTGDTLHFVHTTFSLTRRLQCHIVLLQISFVALLAMLAVAQGEQQFVLRQSQMLVSAAVSLSRSEIQLFRVVVLL